MATDIISRRLGNNALIVRRALTGRIVVAKVIDVLVVNLARIAGELSYTFLKRKRTLRTPLTAPMLEGADRIGVDGESKCDPEITTLGGGAMTGC